ncbi:unnamed protein product [Prunus brigantina]
MSSSKTRAQGSSSSVPSDYITGAGVDNHAIEVRSKLYPFAQKNLDENVLHLFENTLVLGPHWFGPVPPEMAELMRKDAEAPLCFESNSALASHTWVSKNLSRSFPSSEVRNSPVKDENLLAAALCFWNSASNTFDFRVGPMAPTLLDMAQIFGFRPHGRPVDAVGDYHRRKNQEKLAKPFTISPAAINQNCSFSNYLKKFSVEKDKDQQHMLSGSSLQESVLCHPGESLEFVCSRCVLDDSDLAAGLLPRIEVSRRDDLEVHKNARCAMNKINNSADALYPSWEPNSCSSAEFDAWWKTRFQGLPASSTVLKVLFDGWDSWAVHAGEETHQFMVQIIKDINAQIIEDPSLTKNIGGQTVQAGEVIVTSVISAGDLELPSGEEENEDQAEQTSAEATPLVRRKRKDTAPSTTSAGSPSPPPTKSKRLRKRMVVEYVVPEGTAAAPTSTSGTDDELREAFEAIEQENELEALEEIGEKPQEKSKTAEEEEEIPAEVIAESIALAQKQQEETKAELTSSELALFENPEAEQSTTSPATEEQAEQPASEPVEQAELPILVPEAVVNIATAAPEVVVEVPRSASVLAVVTSPLKPPIVAMPIHSLPGSSATASFADPELAEFEAMDLDAQLDKLEKLSSPPSKAKSRAVEEAMERLKIWQSSELELDEDREAFDQLMKDLDLLHRQNMAPRPILEMSLGLARDVLNLYDRYEDLKPTFKTSEFCKSTHEANLADFAKQKAELDQMVVSYKEAKSTADKLAKQIEELQKQLAECREVQNKLGAGLSSKTKATFLVQSMVAASKPALEIAEASIHQGVLLKNELSIKKTNLQETLKKLGF